MKREVELAKRLLESKGYTVSEKLDESHSSEVRKVLIDSDIGYDTIS